MLQQLTEASLTTRDFLSCTGLDSRRHCFRKVSRHVQFHSNLNRWMGHGSPCVQIRQALGNLLTAAQLPRTIFPKFSLMAEAGFRTILNSSAGWH